VSQERSLSVWRLLGPVAIGSLLCVLIWHARGLQTQLHKQDLRAGYALRNQLIKTLYERDCTPREQRTDERWYNSDRTCAPRAPARARAEAALRYRELEHSLDRQPDLSKALLSETDLARGSLTNANLTGADLSYSDLTEVDLSGASLMNASLVNAVLHGTNARGTDFTSVDFTNATIFQAHFDNANLTNTMFRATKIDRTTFAGANLSHSRFFDMSVTGNTLADADLKNTDFRRVDLRGASFGAAELDGIKFRYTCYDATTTWPEGFTPPKPASCVMHTKRPLG
jgi:uncharacterized protein YjbI with pentapeptide repeats